ncbi:hypothetical protein OL229_00975 [Neisseriaceae bacterium JH1-16]|nr:hypothetical protein [Neisseriaceae bacterium JH1-16]
MNAKTSLLGTGLLLGLMSAWTLADDAVVRSKPSPDGMLQETQQRIITTDSPEDKATARMLEETNPTDEQLQRTQPNLDSKTIPVGNHTNKTRR